MKAGSKPTNDTTQLFHWLSLSHKVAKIPCRWAHHKMKIIRPLKGLSVKHRGEVPVVQSPEMLCGYWSKWSWQFHCNEPPFSQFKVAKWLTASNTLGGVHPCATYSRHSCHVCCLQAVYLGYFFISVLPGCLKCHLCLMAALISRFWKNTLWSLPATFAVRLHAEFSCLSHPSRRRSLAAGITNDAKRKSSNYLQLSLSAYIASRCVLTRLLYQRSEEPNLKQHPSCSGCQGHLGDCTGSSALRVALFLGAILLCTGELGEGRVVRDWDCGNLLVVLSDTAKCCKKVLGCSLNVSKQVHWRTKRSTFRHQVLFSPSCCNRTYISSLET